MSFLTLVSIASAFASVVQADQSENVQYALQVLNDLPADMAEPFCSTFNDGYVGGATSTYTVTEAPVTVTTTLYPTPCSKVEGYKPATSKYAGYLPYDSSPSNEGYYPDSGPSSTEDYYADYTTTSDDYGLPEYTDGPEYEDPSTMTDSVFTNLPWETEVFTNLPWETEDATNTAEPTMTEASSTSVDSSTSQITSDGDTTVDITSTLTLTSFLTSTTFVDPEGDITSTLTLTSVITAPAAADPAVTNAFFRVASESLLPASDASVEAIDDFPIMPMADVFAEPSAGTDMASSFDFPTKRSAKSLSSRAIWCDEYNRPCRLVVYDDDVITDACSQYLGDSGSSYAKADVTVTETVYGSTATVTVGPSTCGEAKYPEYTESPSYGYAASAETKYGAPYATTAVQYDTYPVPSAVYDTPGYPQEPKPAVCGPDKIIRTVTTYVTVEDGPAYNAYTPYPEYPQSGPAPAPYSAQSSPAPYYAESSPAPYYSEYSTTTTTTSYYAETTPTPYYVESSTSVYYYGEESTTEWYGDAYTTPAPEPYYGGETSTEVPYYGGDTTTEAPYYGGDTTTEAPYYGDETTTDSVYAEPTPEPLYDQPSTMDDIPFADPTDALFAPAEDPVPTGEPVPAEDPVPIDEPAPADEPAPVEGSGDESFDPTESIGDLPTTTENPFAPPDEE